LVTFLHTADWQIGAKMSNLGNRAQEARDVRIKTAKRVIDLAEALDVDFVLIAGDLFEDHFIGSSTVKQLVQVLSSKPHLPIYVLPGNHDPLVPGGIWDRRDWKSKGENVILLEKAQPLDIGCAILYPCPLTQKQSKQDPTNWINNENTGNVRIGIAHGSLDIMGQNVNFPIVPDRAAVSGLDYLALGDWHSYFPCGDKRTYYPGTFEPTSFKDRDAGYVLHVEISAPQAEPKVTRHKVSELQWITCESYVKDKEDIDGLIGEPEKMGEAKKTLLRLKLRGSASLSAFSFLEDLEDKLKQKFFHTELDLNDLLTYITPESFKDFLPPGPVEDAANDLLAITSGQLPSETTRDYATTDPSVARRALELLYNLAKEEKR